MAARVRWIQFNELVVAENHPDEDDVDNRPLKDILLFSNLNPQAEDFPGFIGCYQGNDNPNSVQTGNVRNAFYALNTGKLWMKQSGENTNTGWAPIGSHLDGAVNPNEVTAARHTGDYYDHIDPTDELYTQQDGGVSGESEHPTWVKRDVPEMNFLAVDWFNGSNDTDIAGRVVDGGDVGASWENGTWRMVTGSPSTLNLTSSLLVPAADTAAYYYLEGVTDLTENCFARAAFGIDAAAVVLNGNVGVGLRFDTATISGYRIDIDVGTGTISVNKLVAGVATLLESDGETLPSGIFRGTIEGRIYNNDDNTVATIEAWYNGRLYCSVTDSTYLTEGVPVVYMEQCLNEVYISEYGAGYYVNSYALYGWFSQAGFEDWRNGCIAIGSRSVASYPNMKNNEEIAWQAGNIAIGIDSTAYSQSTTGGGNIAIGQFSQAVGEHEAIAIGYIARATGENSIGIGGSSWAVDDDCIAIGFSAWAGGSCSIVMGISSVGDGDNTIAIGESAVVNSHHGIAVGQSSLVDTSNLFGMAIGPRAEVEFGHSIAIGPSTEASAINQLMIGGSGTIDSITVEGINEVCIGWGDTNASARPISYRMTNASGTDGSAGSMSFTAGRPTGAGTPGEIIFATAASGSTGAVLQPAATRLVIDSLGLRVTGRIRESRSVVTYSASMTPDAGLGNVFEITATNGTAFTINAPTNPAIGQRIVIVILNTSGGALGVATWNAVFKMTAWTQPANGFSRAIHFYYDGTNWKEIGRTAADVPN